MWNFGQRSQKASEIDMPFVSIHIKGKQLIDRLRKSEDISK